MRRNAETIVMRIYLDHNATTPIRPEVVEAMTSVLREEFGNPSSVYAEGATARARVEVARAQVASLLGVDDGNIRFTGGATEANNTVLFGSLAPGDHVVTTLVEHPSIVEPLAVLEARGVLVDRVAPDEHGCVSAGEMDEKIRDETKLVAMIWANNETGSIQPVEEVAEICGSRVIALHVDATQAIGKCPVDLDRVRVSSLASSAHKLGGPKGVGALVCSGDPVIPPLLYGGGQEKGLRGGTENVAGIVGYGVACELASVEGTAKAKASGQLRDRLWEGIRSNLEGVRWNGGPDRVFGGGRRSVASGAGSRRCRGIGRSSLPFGVDRAVESLDRHGPDARAGAGQSSILSGLGDRRGPDRPRRGAVM